RRGDLHPAAAGRSSRTPAAARTTRAARAGASPLLPRDARASAVDVVTDRHVVLQLVAPRVGAGLRPSTRALRSHRPALSPTRPASRHTPAPLARARPAPTAPFRLPACAPPEARPLVRVCLALFTLLVAVPARAFAQETDASAPDGGADGDAAPAPSLAPTPPP